MCTATDARAPRGGTRRRRALCGARFAACAVVGLGCGATYRPLQGPRIAVVSDGFSRSYVKDGVAYEGGFLGEGLVDATRGVHDAEDHAETYRDLNAASFGLVAAGAIGFGIGSGLLLSSAFREDGTTAAIGAGGGALATSAVVVLVGLALELAAGPHEWDAINAYNDAVDPPRLPAFPGSPPFPTYPPYAPPTWPVAPPGFVPAPPAAPAPPPSLGAPSPAAVPSASSSAPLAPPPAPLPSSTPGPPSPAGAPP